MNKRPKICFVPGNYYPFVGGLAKAARRVVGFLTEAGYEVDVVVPVSHSEHGALPPFETQGGCQIYRIPVGDAPAAEKSRILSQAVWKLDREAKYDLFHAFWFSLAFPLSLVSAPRKVPLLASIRGTDAYESTEPDKLGVTRMILRNLSALTSMNQDLLNRVLGAGELRGATRIIPNSIRIPDGQTWTLGDKNRGVIGTVGKFRDAKAIPDLLEAFSLLPRHLATDLLMVGDYSEAEPGYEQDADARVAALGIADRVRLTGLVSPQQIGDYLGRMHLFVLSSKTEGFPNALLEAAAMGVPLVSTKFPGWEGYLSHEENALMVPVGDPAALAEAISRVLSDPALANKLSEGARRFAGNFSPSREKDAWLALYQQFLN